MRIHADGDYMLHVFGKRAQFKDGEGEELICAHAAKKVSYEFMSK